VQIDAVAVKATPSIKVKSSHANILDYPNFSENLASYFASQESPDAIVIPNPGVAFYAKNKGQHGGPTPREVYIPLLIHNGTIDKKNPIQPIWNLLNFIGK
jgi:hypothetical protein